MPFYKCEWPNGDVSFVLARDVDDAILKLDEFGEAEPAMLKRLSEFMIDLKPNRKILEANVRARKAGLEEEDWPWELGEIGECLLHSESSVLPSEEQTLRRIRKYEKEGQDSERERLMRQRAVRNGTLIDLTARRIAAARKRLGNKSVTETVDEP